MALSPRAIVALAPLLARRRCASYARDREAKIPTCRRRKKFPTVSVRSKEAVLDFTSSFHGVATLSDKGQVVIPAAARKAMGLEAGEKLLVFGWGQGTVMLCKVSEMEKYAGYFAQRVEVARTAIEAVGGRLDPPPQPKTKAGKQPKRGKSRERRSLER